MPNDAEEKKIARLDFDVSMASKSLDEINEKLKKIAQESEKYSKTIGKNLGNSIDAKKIVDTKNFDIELEKIQQIADKIGKNAANNYIKIQGQIQAKAADVEAFKQMQAIKTAEEQIRQNNRVAQSTQSLYDKITQYAKTYVIYQGFNELRKGISDTIEEMTEVQYRMVEIDRVLNESSLDIDNYRDKLIQLAYDYGNSFDNVSDITLRLAKAGFDSQEALALTEKTLLALNTAELSATQATDDMVAVMAQWGLMTGDAAQEAKDYGDIIDKINKIGDNFPTTSEDVMNALKKVSSAFNLAGASIDETIATIVAAEKASQRGGKVIGTALSNIVQQLRAEGKIDIMENLGISVYKDATKSEFNSIIDILGQLSAKMQDLKARGKESSAEMQNLLEVFTVFRRNVGAGLLSEIAGEESTYAKALETSIKSVGYSVQENAKYMQTAKAAQEQFNAELLKLKTSVWDNGLEDVFRSMLLLGKNLAEGITVLVDKFGALPVALGTATLALGLFSKKMKVAFYDAESGMIKTKGLINEIKKFTLNITDMPKSVKEMTDVSNVSLTKLMGNLTKYGVAMDATVLKTLALKAATTALNLATTAAATAGVMLLTTAIQEMANKQQAAIELQQKAIQSTEDVISKLQEEKNSIDETILEYDKIGSKESRTSEDTEKIYELQFKIKDILGEQAKNIDLINGKYEEQRKELEKISLERQKQIVEDKKKFMEQKQSAGVQYNLPSWVERNFGAKEYEYSIMDYGGTGLYEGSLKKTLDNSSLEEAIELFTKWEENLRAVQGESIELANTYNWVTTTLKELTDNVKDSDEATKDYKKSLAELKIMELFPEGTIQNAEDFNKALEAINQMEWSGNLEGLNDFLTEVLEDKFPQFIEMSEAINGTLEDATSVVDATLTSLQNLADQFSILQAAQDEYNSTGELSIQTFQNLINNDLLQYLSIQDGELRINAQTMLDLAEAKKIEAIEALQSAAANDIEKVAIGDVKNISDIAKGAIAGVGNNAATTGNKMQSAASKANNFAAAIQNVINASKDKLGSGVDPNSFQKQASAIRDAYAGIAQTIANISIEAPSYSPQSVGSGRSGGGGSSSSSAAAQAAREAEQAAREAERAAEEEYKRKLDLFKDFVKERERLEKRWVDQQKKLGLISNQDYLYITQQRIERYKEYLAEVEKATWMNQEDRLELQKEYSEKIEDLQTDYLESYRDKIDDEIDALKKSNEERIKLIKDEADKRIDALRKVEKENDRIRTKEEYEKRRLEHLEDISYWEQRTGREAQEALKEAKKNLADLDEQWQKQKEDWSVEDQIKAIEEQRDAQIQAIENAQEKEIKSIEDMYNKKLQLFAETGKIIYESSGIQSQALYNQYKSKFIDPLKRELASLKAALNPSKPATAPAPAPQYIEYTVDPGDTLWDIAEQIYGDGSMWTKIYDENQDVIGSNPGLIYPGQVFNIPQFHQGGIFNPDEGLAVLKKNEMILKPEWSNSMEKLMKYFDGITSNQANPIAGGNVIQIDGNLVNIQADIKSENDMNRLTKKIEKVLTDKFNIKK